MSDGSIPGADKFQMLIHEMRTLALVAGQASVESLDAREAGADARFAGFCTKWADELEALVRSSLSQPQKEKNEEEDLTRVHRQ